MFAVWNVPMSLLDLIFYAKHFFKALCLKAKLKITLYIHNSIQNSAQDKCFQCLLYWSLDSSVSNWYTIECNVPKCAARGLHQMTLSRIMQDLPGTGTTDYKM